MFLKAEQILIWRSALRILLRSFRRICALANNDLEIMINQSLAFTSFEVEMGDRRPSAKLATCI